MNAGRRPAAGCGRWRARLVLALAGLWGAPGAVAVEGVAQPFVLHREGITENGGVRILGALEIPKGTAVDGVEVMGLSALAWDADEETLYALSDRGRLFHFRPRFRDGRLVGLGAVAGFHLKGGDGRVLPRYRVDSEGMVVENAANGVAGDTLVVVSFEGQPRVDVLRPDGVWVARYPLPSRLADVDVYRHPNQALEALAYLPGQGPVTGPERPLWDEAAAEVPLYLLVGHHWRYPLSGDTNGSLVALEAVPEGGLLALERSFVSPFHPLRIRLRRVAALEPGADGRLEVTDVALFSTADGWRVDNFEGLTHHQGRRYFMVSDDNGRDAQRTLFIYFELRE